MNPKILVTGGAGFVGSNLVKKLVDQGYDVNVLDNLSKGRLDYLDGLDIEFFEADIRQPHECEAAFKGVQKVVHLAAYGSVVESVEDPRANFEMNVLGTFNVLNLAVQAGVKKLVFSSTGGALIGNATPPVSEASLPKPISPYGAGKLCCEAYCNAFSESYGLDTVCLRFANVYGPNSLHKVGVINKFVQRLIAKQPLTIFGDGSSTRDYIHVSDLCNGIFLAIENDQIKTDVIHIATGKETSLKELADMFLEIDGTDQSAIEFKPARVGEVERNFALYDYASQKLGYQPKIDLIDGLAETIEYLRVHYEVECS